MSYIETIEEYPIPLERDEIIEIQIESFERENGQIESRNDIIKNVDEFHEKYIDEMIRTDEWSVFRCGWYWDDVVYFWNHQLGYGLAVDGDWETMCGFVEMMEELTNEYSSEDFEPEYYPWQLP